MNFHSIDKLLKWARCFIRIDEELQCLDCGSSILNNFQDPKFFVENDEMTRTSVSLKIDIKRHMQLNKHINNSQSYFRGKKRNLK